MENKKTGTKTSSNEPRYGDDHVFIWDEGYSKRALYVDILYVQGSGSYSTFHFTDGTQVVVSYCLAITERSLPESSFVRVHQSFILNWHFIDMLVGNSVRIGSEWFPVGRVYQKRLQETLHFSEVSRKTRKTES